MFFSTYFASIMVLVGVSLCPLLVIVLFLWFLTLAAVKIKGFVIKQRQWRSTPCPNCIYFTKHQELRCAVNPCQVLTQDAVHCRDFQLNTEYQIYDYKLRENNPIEHQPLNNVSSEFGVRSPKG
ncbi:MAG: hypothetical protein AAGE96_22405 [Cyanobacteria bacterium P01_G01_bin.19]